MHNDHPPPNRYFSIYCIVWSFLQQCELVEICFNSTAAFCLFIYIFKSLLTVLKPLNKFNNKLFLKYAIWFLFTQIKHKSKKKKQKKKNSNEKNKNYSLQIFSCNIVIVHFVKVVLLPANFLSNCTHFRLTATMCVQQILPYEIVAHNWRFVIKNE